MLFNKKFFLCLTFTFLFNDVKADNAYVICTDKLKNWRTLKNKSNHSILLSGDWKTVVFSDQGVEHFDAEFEEMQGYTALIKADKIYLKYFEPIKEDLSLFKKLKIGCKEQFKNQNLFFIQAMKTEKKPTDSVSYINLISFFKDGDSYLPGGMLSSKNFVYSQAVNSPFAYKNDMTINNKISELDLAESLIRYRIPSYYISNYATSLLAESSVSTFMPKVENEN